MSWIQEAEIEELSEKLRDIKALATICKDQNRNIQPQEIMEIINRQDFGAITENCL